jgi:hypothetical protein
MVLPLLARLAGRALISGALDGSDKLKNIPTPELEVSVTDNVKDVLSSLNELERQAIPKAVVRSLNRTVSSVNTQANRRIAKVMGTTVGTVKSRITLLKANSSRWIASLKAGGRPFRLAHFKPRQTKQGVTAAAWGKRKVYKHTFLATVKAGDTGVQGVFVRTGKKRLPIKQLWGPSVPTTFREPEVQTLMSDTAQTQFDKELKRNLDFYAKRKQ